MPNSFYDNICCLNNELSPGHEFNVFQQLMILVALDVAIEP